MILPLELDVGNLGTRSGGAVKALTVIAALLALLPVYSTFLRKINTSIDVAGNNEMTAIDISGEDA